jgi:outer membrane protein assembly factor BamB
MKKMVGLISIWAVAMSLFAGDWPQFCGPDRNNISTETGLADSWPDAGPKVLWEAEVHDGYSGPAIKDGKVYLIDRDEESSLLRCLDLVTGKSLWECSFADPGEMKGKKFAGTRGTPTVTGEAIYFMTGYGTLIRIDPQSKKVVWKRNLLSDFGLGLHQWGHAQAPSIYKDVVIVALDTQDASVFAFDKETGKQVWASPKLGKHSFVSTQNATLHGTDMVVAIGSNEEPPRKRKKKGEEKPEPPKKLQEGHVFGLSPKDGSVLWDYTGWKCKIAIPHPTVLPDNRLFITGGYDAGSAMIQIGKTSEGFAVQELYTTDEVGSQLHQPIPLGDHLFIGSNSNSRKDGLACFGFDGKLAWRTKDIDGAPNFERGSLIMADGKLIILDGKSGILYLVKADTSEYKQLASAKMVEENDMAWAPLALSNGKLLVRDWNTLKCVDLK